MPRSGGGDGMNQSSMMTINPTGMASHDSRPDDLEKSWWRFLTLLADLQHGQEGFLRDLDRADLLHALLAFLLLLEQLALARDVAAVALGDDVLAQRLDVSRAMILAPIAAWIATSNIWRGISSLHLRRPAARPRS